MTAPRVLFRDARWLAVEKPSGITTTPLEGSRSLVELVRETLAPQGDVLHPLSRLDYDVTGVVLFALTRDATRLAAEVKREGRYARTYHALVSPPPKEPAAVWREPIGIDPRNAHRRVVGGREPESAESEMTLRERRGEVAWLVLHPRTGRTHQLRVHCAHAGCPLLGDRTYGGAKRLTLSNGAVLAAGRVMLHCAEVSLPGGPSLRAPWPDDLRTLWESLPAVTAG